jgi:hypothetical protein
LLAAPDATRAIVGSLLIDSPVEAINDPLLPLDLKRLLKQAKHVGAADVT